jgi:hypothetical protein
MLCAVGRKATVLVLYEGRTPVQRECALVAERILAGESGQMLLLFVWWWVPVSHDCVFERRLQVVLMV